MTDTQRALDELWNALYHVMVALKDSGAGMGQLHEATKHMDKASEFLARASTYDR